MQGSDPVTPRGAMTDTDLGGWVDEDHGDGDHPVEQHSSVTLRTWGNRRGWVFSIVEGTPWAEVRELVVLAIRAEHFAIDRVVEHARKYDRGGGR